MEMTAKQKMAITGAGLVAVGVGLSALGAVLIVPAVLALTAGVVEKAAKRLTSGFEHASKTAGAVAGTLQRSFTEATKAGLAEGRRSWSNGSDEAA
jgi:hypothetical protein